MDNDELNEYLECTCGCCDGSKMLRLRYENNYI